MKTKIIILTLLCTACAEKPLSTLETQNLLSQYTWSYTPQNSNIPIKFSFNNDQVSAYTSCNAMGAHYKIVGQKMSIPIFFGDTQMCSAQIEQQEYFIRMFFLQPVAFKINSRSDQHPKLIFQKDKQKYIFIGTKSSSKN